MTEKTPGRMRELVTYFLKLGILGFGGPVALVGQMERELVQERGWLTGSEMRDAIAVSQTMPGPLAIQVGILVSYMRGGFWGAWLGGACFILPNFLIVTMLAAAYVAFNGLSWMQAVFYGVSPAVIALIIHSCWRLAKIGMEHWLQWAIAAVCFLLTVILRAEIALLFIASGLIGLAWYGDLLRRKDPADGAALAFLPWLGAWTSADSGSQLLQLLWFFLKAGSLTFGSGLVIVPFLENGVVRESGWLDAHQFLVAVAVGMISPGPVVITATFVGYLVQGFLGALVATVGMFLPSFVMVLVVGPLLLRHRGNANVQGFVKGAYGAAIGTIAGASVLLGRIALGDWLTTAIGLVSLFALFRWKIPNPALMAAAAVVGLVAFPLLKPDWVFVR
jgi:chromate transporter